MKEIQLTARLKIHDGKLEEFKVVAASALETVREKDAGARQYVWFLSADQSEPYFSTRAGSTVSPNWRSRTSTRVGGVPLGNAIPTQESAGLPCIRPPVPRAAGMRP